MGREDRAFGVAGFAPGKSENFHGLFRQWDYMLLVAFHPFLWDREGFFFPVYIVPNSLSYLAATVLCESYENEAVFVGPPKMGVPDFAEVTAEILVWS